MRKTIALGLLSSLALTGCLGTVDVPAPEIESEQPETVIETEVEAQDNTEEDTETGSVTETELEITADSGSEAETLVASGEIVPFTRTAYNNAVAAGKTVAIDFHAEWCPTCKANEPELAAAAAQLGADTVFFRADYDEETELKSELGVASQSTLVVLPNGNSGNIRSYTGFITKNQALELING